MKLRIRQSNICTRVILQGILVDIDDLAVGDPAGAHGRYGFSTAGAQRDHVQVEHAPPLRHPPVWKQV